MPPNTLPTPCPETCECPVKYPPLTRGSFLRITSRDSDGGDSDSDSDRDSDSDTPQGLQGLQRRVSVSGSVGAPEMARTGFAHAPRTSSS